MLIIGVCQISLQGAIIIVTTNVDELDGDVNSITDLQNTPGGTGISLREAISAANNTPGEDEIRFAAGTNGMVFLLDIGTTNEDVNADGDLDITDDDGLIITGNGETNTIIDGDNDERIFDQIDGDLAITGVTIQNGNQPGNDHFDDSGGGLANFGSGNLTLVECIFRENDSGASGGGFIFQTSSGTLVVQDCQFIMNSADSGGGGGENGAANSKVFVTNSNFSNNTADIGGGFESGGGSVEVTIVGSIFSQNHADRFGGGLANSGGGTSEFIVTNSLIFDNDADDSGGGVPMLAGEKFTFINCTLTGNRANIHGGGIQIEGGTSTISFNFVTISNNCADNDADGNGDGGGIYIGSDTVNIHNSIIQNNVDKTPLETITDDCSNPANAPLNSLGGNVVGANTGCPAGLNDTTAPANLGPLQNNGGPTQTHAINATSAAHNFAVCDGVNMDQRMFFRYDGLCDSGAYEFGATEGEPIPTMAQWGIGILGIILVIFGTVCLRARPRQRLLSR